MTRTQATKDLLTKSGSALFNTFHLSSLTINLGAQNCLITSGCIEILDGPTETTNAILLKTFVHAEHSCNINDTFGGGTFSLIERNGDAKVI